MRHASKWIATLAVFGLCTLTFALQPPEAFSGDSYFLVKGGAYTPQSSAMDNFAPGASSKPRPDISSCRFYPPNWGAATSNPKTAEISSAYTP